MICIYIEREICIYTYIYTYIPMFVYVHIRLYRSSVHYKYTVYINICRRILLRWPERIFTQDPRSSRGISTKGTYVWTNEIHYHQCCEYDIRGDTLCSFIHFKYVFRCWGWMVSIVEESIREQGEGDDLHQTI